MEHLRSLADGFLTRVPDERTAGWPLLEFNTALAAAALYVAVVVALPRLLSASKGEAPKPGAKSAPQQGDLRSIRLVYNAVMTLANLYFVLEILRQAYLTTWFGAITPGEQGLGMARVLYLYYLSKVLEWIDTVIMIVRGAHRQLSFLHVYHHVGTFLVWRFNVAFYPGGEAYPPALFNSFVHVVMYYYYFQSTRGFQPWWKMYLTRLQISQLFSFVLLGVYAMIGAEPKHRYIGIINGGFAFTLLVLFCHFYFASYGRRAAASKHAHSPSTVTASAKRKEE